MIPLLANEDLTHMLVLLKDATKMSQKGALGLEEVPMLGRVSKRCQCNPVPFCCCWPPLPQYRSGAPVVANPTSYFYHFLTASSNCPISRYDSGNSRR